MPQAIGIGLAAWLVVINAITLGAFWLDKRRASRGRWRTRERSLHTLELLGGWPGSFVAGRAWRHKTRDRRYRAVRWCVVALHVAVAAGVAWLRRAG